MSAATARVLDTSRDGRMMAGVLAIMLFLTVLAAAGGIAAARGSTAFRTALMHHATVQIVAADGHARRALAARALTVLRTSPAVTKVEPVSTAEVARLLGSWVGDAATGAELPIPMLIDIEVAPRAGALAQVRASLTAIGPAVRVDAHDEALAKTGMLLTMLTALAMAIVVLMVAGSAAMVLLTVRAGLAAHRDTIDVMHGLGATDVQVAALFRRRMVRDSAVGAGAGALAAWAVILVLGHLAAGAGSQLIGGMTLGQGGWIVVVALPLAFVALAALIAYLAVVRALGRTI